MRRYRRTRDFVQPDDGGFYFDFDFTIIGEIIKKIFSIIISIVAVAFAVIFILLLFQSDQWLYSNEMLLQIFDYSIYLKGDLEFWLYFFTTAISASLSISLFNLANELWE